MLLKKDKDKDIVKLSRIRIDKYGEGVYMYMEAVVKYGCNIPEVVNKFQAKAKKEIERLTSMNVQKVEVFVRAIRVDGNDIELINN